MMFHAGNNFTEDDDNINNNRSEKVSSIPNEKKWIFFLYIIFINVYLS